MNNFCKTPLMRKQKWEKVLLTMKIFFFVFFLSIHSMYASVYAQETVLSIKLDHQDFSELEKQITRQSDFLFFYNDVTVRNIKDLTIDLQNTGIYEILDRCLKGLNYGYKVKDKTIILFQLPANPQAKKKIQGTVVDENGSPLPGATVKIKGTGLGIATDIEGKFALELPVNAKTVIISFVGYKEKEMPVGSNFTKIMLEPVNTQLDEVVVNGYQKVSRKLFTGSATTVDAEETLLKGAPDVTGSLQGKVAGVQVNNVSGTFGASPVLTIRGNSSINGTNKPLWVVDGVILEDLVNVSAEELTSGNLSTLLSSGVAGLNPEDIKSFEILKDVSATSLYGAQAMNGVIVITTKQGSKGKLNVNYTGNISIKERPHYSQFDIMSSDDEMSVYKELEHKGWIDITSVARAENFGAMGKMFDQISKGNINWGADGALNEEFLSRYANSNTDWFDALFHNSITHQHSLTISGGSEKATYYASFSYYGDNGMAIKSDEVDRYTATLKGNFDLSKQVKLGLKLSANVRDQRVPGTKDRSFDNITGEFTRDFDINPFSYVLNTSRSMRAHDDNGDLEFFRRSYTDFNILYELGHNYVDLSVKDISAQADLEYNPVKSLTLRGTFQYRRATTLREHKIHESSNQAQAYRADFTQDIIDANRYLFKNPDKPTSNPYSILPQGGFYNTDETDLNHTYFRATADYSPGIGENHALNLFAGFELNMVERENRANDGWGYLWDRGGVIVTHPDVMKYLSSQGQNYFGYAEYRDRRISGFVNTAYSYKGRYVANAGFRYDGSNQLGASRTARYLPSWNVSGAWNMHAEMFMQATSVWLNVLKPKISYGYNGIMGPSTSAELTIFSRQTLRPTDNEVYNEITSLQNDELTWEKMYELNAGLEFAVLGNRLTGDFAYYNRRSVDLIDYVTTSGIGGEAIKLGNIGNMKSSGYELSLSSTNIRTDKFQWTTHFNMNFHKSEITKLNNFSRMSAAVSNIGVAMLGYPQRGLFSVRFAGLDAQGIPTFYGADNEIVYDMNLQQRDGIDKILKYEGPLEPKGYGGLTNSFRYRDWEFSFGFVYKYGNVIRLDDKYYPYYNDYSAFPKDLKNRWTLPGDENITNIPAILDRRTYDRIEDMQTYQLYNKSTERVAKGDFIRLKDVTLRYSFPRTLLSRTFLKSASLSFQATNLCLLYSDKNLNGIDPEFYLSGGVSSPVSRMYTFTLNVGF